MMSNSVPESEKEILTGCVSFCTQWFDVCVCIRVRGLHLVCSFLSTCFFTVQVNNKTPHLTIHPHFSDFPHLNTNHRSFILVIMHPFDHRASAPPKSPSGLSTAWSLGRPLRRSSWVLWVAPTSSPQTAAGSWAWRLAAPETNGLDDAAETRKVAAAVGWMSGPLVGGFNGAPWGEVAED